jgi:archaellum component FlaC
MAEEPINLVLEHLRAMRLQMNEMNELLHDHSHRLNRIELTTAGVRRAQAGDAENVAHLGTRVDRLADDVALVRNRLGMAD